MASIFGFEDLTVKFVHGSVGRPSLSFRETSRSREYWRVLRGKLPCGAVAVLLITMTKRKAAGEDNKQLSSWLDAVSASKDRTGEKVRRDAEESVSSAIAIQTNAVYSSQQMAPFFPSLDGEPKGGLVLGAGTGAMNWAGRCHLHTPTKRTASGG